MINSFRGKYRFLSNFFPAEVTYRGWKFRTTEAAYQASKTDNPFEIMAIQAAETPGQAKKLGREVTLRPGFEYEKINIMLELQRLKFSHHELASSLLRTGNECLIEGNTWHDNFWGDCNCPECTYTPGKNCLGILLMQVRDELNELEVLSRQAFMSTLDEPISAEVLYQLSELESMYERR
jgi:ribA/ribD-fused uncharacterized protein